MDDDGKIAVIGAACRFPGADDVEAYWKLLYDGQEGITHFDRSWLIAQGADPAIVRRQTYVPSRGVLTNARAFDWSLFAYSKAEAATIDPQQRVFLECAFGALDDAGLDPARFTGWIGVFAGSDGPTLTYRNARDDLTNIIGTNQDFLTSRVAYKFGLRGPAITVQTACSTSLTAVHLAVQSLLGYECDAALAGGVSVAAPGAWGYMYEPGSILSPDGHCRPFDEDAAGTVPAEGVGIVVLKRLGDALAAGDRIAAVLWGTALNNDGNGKVGYTAPSVTGQREVVSLAQKVAGVDANAIGYVEAHGTATRLGDPVEVQALAEAFGPRDGEEKCWLGAVKGNIGHTGAAAGVAGLIKTVLMLERRTLVPTLHFRAPNPLLRLDETPFRVCTQAAPWEPSELRLAAVSSFGVGGTNAHVVLSEGPERRSDSSDGAPHVFALSAASPQMLARYRQDLTDYVEAHPQLTVGALSRTLCARRELELRQAVVAGSTKELCRWLRAPQDPVAREKPARVAFLLPGQGTLTHPAGAVAYELLPEFRAAFDRVASSAPVDLTPVVAASGASAEWFTDTVNQQLGLFAVGYALGCQLTAWGIRPELLLGNSIGEYAAALLAGIWDPVEATAFVHARARAMYATKPGQMVAVVGDPGSIRRRLPSGTGIAVAVAGPGLTVLSGDGDEVTRFVNSQELADAAVRRLETRRAFHSVMMDPAVAAVRRAAGTIRSHPPATPIVSTLTGEWVRAGELQTPEYWARQVRETVQLDAALETALTAGCDTFIELGPGSSMIDSAQRHRLWRSDCVGVALLGRPTGNGDSRRVLSQALAILWQNGVDVDPQAMVVQTDRARQIKAPTRRPDHRDPQAADATPWPAVGEQHTLRDDLAAIWCGALGTASVDDDDDFFSLGGESLAAVTLIAKVREKTGADVAVTDFTRQPTFARLYTMVEQAPRLSAGQVPGAVPLRIAGLGRPLFLIADARGSTSSYRLLAETLDLDRPIVGIEPVGASAVRIPELARQHVIALRRVQPDGPYTLVGWSFGAAVAHEMASQLERDGAIVDKLVFLDGYAPDHRRRVAFVEFLTANTRLWLEVSLGIGRLGHELRTDPAARCLFSAKIAVLLCYDAKPVTLPMSLLAVGGSHRAKRLEQSLRALYTTVEVRPVPGDHWSMLERPYVTDVARELTDALRRGVTTS